MNKKPDTASALAGIIRAKRGNEGSPSPALPSAGIQTQFPRLPTTAAKARGGKSSDKANYSQYSVYLRKDTRKKVSRTLDDADTGQDFSELVQELLEKWLASRT